MSKKYMGTHCSPTSQFLLCKFKNKNWKKFNKAYED